ncbi:MAG: hypothetical protein RR398_00785 [Clostridia bacterium]
MIDANDELFTAVKRDLQITWYDVNTDLSLVEYISNGVVELDGIAGAPQDYASPGLPRRLLFDYARYARAEALDEWKQNYRSDLTQLRVNRISEEEKYAEKTE